MKLSIFFPDLFICLIHFCCIYAFVRLEKDFSTIKKEKKHFSKVSRYTGYYLTCLNLKINGFSKILFKCLYFFVVIEVLLIPVNAILYILMNYKMLDETFLVIWIKGYSKFGLIIFYLFSLLFLINHKKWRANKKK